MTALFTVLLTVVLVSLSLRVWARRTRADARLCAACGGDPEVLCAAGDGPNLTYDVTCCPTCATAAARVDGLPHPKGWCPACHHHALTLDANRLPGPVTRVAIEEHCEACGYTRDFQVPQRAPDAPRRFGVAPQGKVLAFAARATPRVDPRPEPAGALVELPAARAAPPVPPSRANDQGR